MSEPSQDAVPPPPPPGRARGNAPWTMLAKIALFVAALLFLQRFVLPRLGIGT